MRKKLPGGFTLVEMLVVIAITITLASFLLVALMPQKEKALRKNTEAMLEAIKNALDQYHNEFRDFPPDGYDNEKGWFHGPSAPGTLGTGNVNGNPAGSGVILGGRRYYGSACLVYFLCYPIANVTVVGTDPNDPRNIRVNPCNKGSAFLTTLKKENFSVFQYDPTFEIAIRPGTAAYRPGWENCEIVDAYGWPIHYDKCGQRDPNNNDTQFFQASKFRGNMNNPRGNIHSDTMYYDNVVLGKINDDAQLRGICPTDIHNPGGTGGLVHADPRAPAEDDGCVLDSPTKAPNKPVPRNPGSYDLWSHGKAFANGITAIGNWK